MLYVLKFSIGALLVPKTSKHTSKVKIIMQAGQCVMRRVTSEKEYRPLAAVDHHRLQALDADNR